MFAAVMGTIPSGKNHIDAALAQARKQSGRPPWYSGVVEKVTISSELLNRGTAATTPACVCGIGFGRPEDVPEVWQKYATSDKTRCGGGGTVVALDISSTREEMLRISWESANSMTLDAYLLSTKIVFTSSEVQRW